MVDIQISPEELYYLSKFCGGKYLNYVYIAIMDDIQQNPAVYDRNCKESLRKKGILKESFTGNVTLHPAVTKLLEPMFFGSFESSVDICWKGTPSRVKVYRFHWHEGKCTMVTSEGRTLRIQAIDSLHLPRLVLSLMPEGYQKQKNRSKRRFPVIV